MSVAARIDPKDYFTPEEWAPLSARSSWKGLALVAHCWATIGLMWAMTIAAVHFFGPLGLLSLIVAVPVIGGRQLGLGILQHDAAHGALHPNAKFGDWVSNYICLNGVEAYRKYHLQHHKFAQQSEDPDLVLSAPFPISKTSLRRKIVRDLTGQTWFKQRFGGFQGRENPLQIIHIFIMVGKPLTMKAAIDQPLARTRAQRLNEPQLLLPVRKPLLPVRLALQPHAPRQHKVADQKHLAVGRAGAAVEPGQTGRRQRQRVDRMLSLPPPTPGDEDIVTILALLRRGRVLHRSVAATVLDADHPLAVLHPPSERD